MSRGTSPVSTPIRKRTISPSRSANRTAITAAMILMAVLTPEDLAGNGRTMAFGIRGSLIITNGLTKKRVLDQIKTLLRFINRPGAECLTPIWLRQSIYRERYEREPLVG